MATFIGRDKLALVVVCAALNLTIGAAVGALKLPFYLDSIGTLVATAIGGFWVGAATGVLATLVGSAYTPTLWAYAGTAIVISLYASVLTKVGFLRRLWPTAIGGLGLGIVSAVASAPITTYLWSGVSLAGADAVTAFLSATGKTLAESVLLGGLATDPVDKLFTSLVALAILARMPRRWVPGGPVD